MVREIGDPLDDLETERESWRRMHAEFARERAEQDAADQIAREADAWVQSVRDGNPRLSAGIEF